MLGFGFGAGLGVGLGVGLSGAGTGVSEKLGLLLRLLCGSLRGDGKPPGMVGRGFTFLEGGSASRRW